MIAEDLGHLTVEQQDALDEFLSDAEWTLGETISTTDRRLTREGY